MKALFAIPLLGVLAAGGAQAAGPADCSLSVEGTSPDAMVAALMPKSEAQIEACAARGIRFARMPQGETAGEAAGKKAGLAAPAEPNGFAALSLPILFATGSAQIQPAALPIVDGLGKALASPALQPYRFRIEGHTDTVGDLARNRVLSERRAQAVTHYLVLQFKLDPHRLEPVGYGADQLAVPTPPETAEARNRRVQVVNIGTRP
jgi:outer membrane protein OmpA-like peptidoglycan-associated protein